MVEDSERQSSRDVHVCGTPASFGTARLHLLLLFLSLASSLAIVTRGVPAVVAFTRDAMPPNARSPRRGAAKNDHQVSRLPLCTHTWATRARVLHSRTHRPAASSSLRPRSPPLVPPGSLYDCLPACPLALLLALAALAPAAAAVAAATAVPLSQQWH